MGDKGGCRRITRTLNVTVAESGLNSVGDGEPWKGFNQASDMIPPASEKDRSGCGGIVGGRGPEAGRPGRRLPPAFGKASEV